MWFKKIRLHFSTKGSVQEVFEDHKTKHSKEIEVGDVQLLSDLIKLFRPLNIRTTDTVSITALIDYLQNNPSDKVLFKNYLETLVAKKEFYSILTEFGIVQNKPFGKELRRRLFAKLIPEQHPKHTLEYVLSQIFPFRSDIQWISKISKSELVSLCEVLGIIGIYEPFSGNGTSHEILKALNLISQRISGQALESEVIKMVPELADFESPFEALEIELNSIEKRFFKEKIVALRQDDLDLKQLLVLHGQCVAFIDKAFRNSAKYGITLSLSQRLLKVRQELRRFAVLIDYLTLDQESEALSKSVDFGLRLIKFHCLKNTISKLINDSTQSIAYEITQHSAKTGEHYITSGRRDYLKMFKTAMGGGLIVGFLCIFKVLLGKVETSDFGHAFLYSLNYAFGFIAIYLLGFTLATKQPAMTAATLIRAIERGMKYEGNSKLKHRDFAELFARLFRSQFIAFVGNVILAFPVALGLIYLIDLLTNVNIAEAKHEQLIKDISPLHSPAIFHSAIAGVFLFLSGLISGGISNKNKHINLYYRIQEHPALKTIFGRAKTKKLANWFEKKWPGVASNFWFGVFMGSVASFGVFFGLNLDIRHITFASGNLALGLFGNDFQISVWMLTLSILGIGIIGFVNFAVSFLLSLTLALRSRSISWKELFPMFRSVWNYFKQKPLTFFIPTKQKQ